MIKESPIVIQLGSLEVLQLDFPLSLISSWLYFQTYLFWYIGVYNISCMCPHKFPNMVNFPNNILNSQGAQFDCLYCS